MDQSMSTMYSKLLIPGFLLMAAVSIMLTFKQARAVDAMGDVAKVNAKISELQWELQDDDTDKDQRKKIEEEIKELREEDLPDQRQDATNAMAAMPNGAVLWTFLSQVGAAAFGLGVLGVFLKNEEHPMVRSVALLVIGGGVLVLILSRYAYLNMGGVGGIGGSL